MHVVNSESSDEEPAKRVGKGGLMAEKEISDDLMNLLSCKKMMARTDVVKRMWEYIREHNLQNPQDKREIILDSRMKEVFKVDNFTMFRYVFFFFYFDTSLIRCRLTVSSMNKYIGAHIDPYKPVDLTTNPSAKKRKAKKPAGGESGEKKKRAPGVQAPWRLSEAMVAVVGKPVLPRPQVTQALWAYIRENNLQNPADKREIICDDRLRAVMGGQDRVTMFSMNKYIGVHLLEKLNKSEYDPSDFKIEVPAAAAAAAADSPSEVNSDDE